MVTTIILRKLVLTITGESWSGVVAGHFLSITHLQTLIIRLVLDNLYLEALEGGGTFILL